MAHVTLPLLSGAATGSIGSNLAFVKSSKLTICRTLRKHGLRPAYVKEGKDAIFSAYSFAISAIKKQSDTVTGGSYLYNMLTTSRPSSKIWNAFCILKLGYYFHYVIEFSTYFASFSNPNIWIAHNTLPWLFDLNEPEYDQAIPSWQQNVLQALALHLLKPWDYGFNWTRYDPKTWDEDKIAQFAITQLD